MIDRTSHMTRRGFIASAGLAATAAWVVPDRLPAQEPNHAEGIVETLRNAGATAKVEVQKLRGDVSVLIGSGGNIAVLDGQDGKVLVDAGLAGSRPQIGEALARMTSRPVKYLINTHWHFDHTDGTPVGAKPQLIEFRDMLVTIRDRVAGLKMQGTSLDEIIVAKRPPHLMLDGGRSSSMVRPSFAWNMPACEPARARVDSSEILG